jgi:hypothetical protein
MRGCDSDARALTVAADTATSLMLEYWVPCRPRYLLGVSC